MKLSTLQLNINNKMSFGDSNQDEFKNIGFDDHNSHNTRKHIRKNSSIKDYFYYQTNNPELINGRISQYELDKLIKVHTKRKKINDKKLKNIELVNLEKISENLYKGGCLIDEPESLQKLKDAGVTTIIDLTGSQDYENMIKDIGLKYVSSFVNTERDVFTHDVFRKDDAKTVTNFVKQIKTINDAINKKDSVCYINCQHGIRKSTNALYLVSLLNPEAKFKKQPFDYEAQKTFYNFLTAKLLTKLSNSDKELLNITPEYDLELRQNIHNKLMDSAKKTFKLIDE